MTNTYTLKIKNEDLSTYLREEASWTANEKLEYDIEVDSSEKILNFGDIDNIRLFIIYTNSPIIVKFTQGTNIIDFEIQDILTFSPTSNFITNLTAITLSSLSGVADVNIRIYGAS